MSNDEISTYEVQFTVTETVEVESQMLENHADGNGVDTHDAVELAREILHTAPAFDHLGYDPVEDATVSGIVEKRPTEDGIEKHHHRAQKPEGVFHRFAKIEPKCPDCGERPSGYVSDEGSGGWDGGLRSTVCDECGRHYYIQYRAVDVSWEDSEGNNHEAVADGILEPTYFAYPHADEFAHDDDEEADDD